VQKCAKPTSHSCSNLCARDEVKKEIEKMHIEKTKKLEKMTA
jgi:hypothetical protein